jgi:WD40 repeat protein
MRVLIPFLLFFSLSFPLIAQVDKDGSITLSGKSVHWSPAQNAFLYGSTGKSSGAILWRLYSLLDNSDETLFFGKNMSPVWSFDGKYIAYQENATLKISDLQGNISEFKTPVSAIDTIMWSPDSLKILYSGDSRIYLYDILSRNNAEITHGRKPFYLRGNAGLLYMDDTFSVYFMDPTGEREILLSDIDDYQVNRDGTLAAFYNGTGNRIILMQLYSKRTNSFPVDARVEGFSFDARGKYLVYGLEGKGIRVLNVAANRSALILKEGSFPAFSFDGLYLSYELPKSVLKIIPTERFKDAFPTVDFYRIALGSKDGLKKDDFFLVFEEKVNPFNGTVTGFDLSKPKGKARIVAVFDSYALLEKVEGNGSFEINDAVVTTENVFKTQIMGIER